MANSQLLGGNFVSSDGAGAGGVIGREGGREGMLWPRAALAAPTPTAFTPSHLRPPDDTVQHTRIGFISGPHVHLGEGLPVENCVQFWWSDLALAGPCGPGAGPGGPTALVFGASKTRGGWIFWWPWCPGGRYFGLHVVFGAGPTGGGGSRAAMLPEGFVPSDP